MSSGAPAALKPTFEGHVASTNDALILFENCLHGNLQHVPRRPHDRERNSLIRSGCIFIYEENASGIKRWTDGVTWSPSRILGNFLVYRELDKPFPPGEKKRAMKKNRRPTRPGEPYQRPEGATNIYPPDAPPAQGFNGERPPTEMERALIGSLIDSYGFKQDGLVKKTMSVTVQGVTHHLVSYYSVADVTNGTLRTPSNDPNVNFLRPRLELTQRQSFRAPIEETDEQLEGHPHSSQPHYSYPPQMMGQPGYGPAPGVPYLQRDQYNGIPHPSPSTYPQHGVGAAGMPSSYVQNYAPQAHHAPYGRPYDSLNGAGAPSSLALSMAPAMTSTASSTTLPDRSHSSHGSMSYPQMNLQQSRPLGVPSSTTTDPRTNSFPRNNYGLSTSTENLQQAQHGMDARRALQASPTQLDRRDSQSAQPSLYYMNGGSSAMGHAHYQPSWGHTSSN